MGHLVGSALAGSGLGLLGLAEDVEIELLVEARQVAIGGDGEQLVGEVEEDAVVAGGVIDEGGLELSGHERGIAGGGEAVLEAGEQLVAGGILEDETASDA